jgi:hypothetical protein
MTFNAQIFRVFIASPSDLTEERDAATEVINDWNAQHAAAEGVVLLPVRWETHARPQSGTRPQQAINDQLVSTCDILLGMFWTRVGTSTGVAESGTTEEFDQFVTASKPALLYFSRRLIDPARIDAKQHAKLKAFKKQTLTNALVGEFATIQSLKDQLLRNLTDQVRELKVDKPKRDRLTRHLNETPPVVDCPANIFWLGHDLARAIRLAKFEPQSWDDELGVYLRQAMHHLNQTGVQAPDARKLLLEAFRTHRRLAGLSEQEREKFVTDIARAKNEIGDQIGRLQAGFKGYPSIGEQEQLTKETKD